MAQAKQKNNILSTITMLLFALMPLVYVKTLVDKTLIPHQLFGSVGLVLLILAMLANKSISKAKVGWMLLSFVGFLVINMIAVSAAINPVESWATISRYMLSFGVLTALTVLFQAKKLNPESLIKGVVIFGTIAGVITLFEILKALGSGDFISNIYVVSGTFSHKNLLSSVLMLCLPFAIMGAVILEKGWKSLSLFLTFLLIAEVFVLRTRGVWLAVFISAFAFLLMFFTLRKRQSLDVKFPIKQVGLAAGIAVVLLIALFSAAKVSSSVSDTANLENRFVFWNNSVEMLKENPVLGVGPGNWKINFPKYGLQGLENSVLQGITHVQRPHNDYLWVLTEAGPLALIFYVGIFALAFLQLAKSFKQPLNKKDLTIDISVGFGLMAYLVFSLTDFPLERTSHGLLVVAMLALVFRNVQLDQVKGFNVSARALLVIILGLGVFSTTVCAYRWQGEKASVKVLDANSHRNAQRMIPAAEEALNPYYNMDNFANPIRYYSSLGKLVLKDINGAMQDGLEAVDVAPYNIIALNQLGNVYKAQKQTDLALETYDKATEISPVMEAARMSSAEIYLDKGDYISAYGEMKYMFRNTKGPRYQKIMEAILPALVGNFEEHGEYNSLVQYLRSKNPKTPAQMLAFYREWKKR
ncbi:O-antigen ligase family protein [Owenweeksia hongkongensis]|uniref:O-antigen ligase family protein n=1 Tax=Owenweeksia hongkongensis TaxID=253245 RepID=UPI003A953051